MVFLLFWRRRRSLEMSLAAESDGCRLFRSLANSRHISGRIFPRERSDDRKYVCCSQARVDFVFTIIISLLAFFLFRKVKRCAVLNISSRSHHRLRHKKQDPLFPFFRIFILVSSHFPPSELVLSRLKI